MLKTIAEVFSRLKRGRVKCRIACPKCGSFNVKPMTALDDWLTPAQYVCEDCGYTGPIILEVEENTGGRENGG